MLLATLDTHNQRGVEFIRISRGDPVIMGIFWIT